MSDQKNYIVTLKDSASTDQISTVKLKVGELGGKILDEFSLIKGFSVKLPHAAADAIGKHDLVNSIEEDKEVKIQ